MKEYTFITTWNLKNASLDAAWNVIKAVDEWPQWWKGVKSVQTIREGDSQGIGKISLFVFKSALPYELTFRSELLQLKKHELMIGKAHGELEGTGIWTFAQQEDIIRIVYVWNVKTTQAWMNFLAPLLRPAFKWNHDVVMRWGLQGLAKRLQATIVNV